MHWVRAPCSSWIGACRRERSLSQPLLSDSQPEPPLQPCTAHAVLFAFSNVRYSVLLAAERRVKRVLTDVSGCNAPVQGLLTPEAACGSFTAAPALMCILGPSGAGMLAYVVSVILVSVTHVCDTCYANSSVPSFACQQAEGLMCVCISGGCFRHARPCRVPAASILSMHKRYDTYPMRACRQEQPFGHPVRPPQWADCASATECRW